MKVELMNHAPQDPDKYVALAMRRTRDTSTISVIEKSLNARRDWIEKLVRLAKKEGHYSVFEHIVYWFSIEEVSRALTHELVRHRIASYAQLSGRTVNIDEGYVVPSLDYVSSGIERAKLQRVFKEKYREQFKAYTWLIDKGVKIEDARYLLPNGQWTCIMVTINARSLMHLIRMRSSSKAQWEIREMAERMWILAKPTAPVLWEYIPECI